MADAGGRILAALEELPVAQRRRLVAALNRGVGEGFPPIPHGLMEGGGGAGGGGGGGDPLDLTRLLLGHYGEEGAAEAAARALEAVPRRDLAARLRGRGFDDLIDDVTAPPLPPPSPEELLVARLRPALVQRVRGTGPLLDQLEARGLLRGEEVATVATGPTPQARMRLLLATSPSWGRRGHRLFLETLRNLHPWLMEELEGGEGAQEPPEGPQEPPEGPQEPSRGPQGASGTP